MGSAYTTELGIILKRLDCKKYIMCFEIDSIFCRISEGYDPEARIPRKVSNLLLEPRYLTDIRIVRHSLLKGSSQLCELAKNNGERYGN